VSDDIPPDGAILMRFASSESQYEYRFEKWGLRKYQTHKNWQIISCKINKRKKDGKNSDDYRSDELISAKRPLATT
jgi:hypothetical protein